MPAQDAELELALFLPVYPPFRRTSIATSEAGADTASIQTAIGNAKSLHGWAFAETTAAAGAAFRICDGSATTYEVLARINLSSNESTCDYWGPNGIQVRTGRIYLEWISGSYEGVLYWRD